MSVLSVVKSLNIISTEGHIIRSGCPVSIAKTEREKERDLRDAWLVSLTWWVYGGRFSGPVRFNLFTSCHCVDNLQDQVWKQNISRFPIGERYNVSLLFPVPWHHLMRSFIGKGFRLNKRVHIKKKIAEPLKELKERKSGSYRSERLHHFCFTDQSSEDITREDGSGGMVYAEAEKQNTTSSIDITICVMIGGQMYRGEVGTSYNKVLRSWIGACHFGPSTMLRFVSGLNKEVDLAVRHWSPVLCYQFSEKGEVEVPHYVRKLPLAGQASRGGPVVKDPEFGFLLEQSTTHEAIELRMQCDVIQCGLSKRCGRRPR